MFQEVDVSNEVLSVCGGGEAAAAAAAATGAGDTREIRKINKTSLANIVKFLLKK
jgi:hypothetical protein